MDPFHINDGDLYSSEEEEDGYGGEDMVLEPGEDPEEIMRRLVREHAAELGPGVSRSGSAASGSAAAAGNQPSNSAGNRDFPRPNFDSAPGGSKPPWPAEFGVEVVTLQPGEALVFTESLMHSTALYSGRGQRRTLFCTRHP